MKTLFRSLFIPILVIASLLVVTPAFAQDATSQPPAEIDAALAVLSERFGVELTVADLAAYRWSAEQFPDASLGCPREGQLYAQVITPGYQFLLVYDDTSFDIRVAEDGDNVVLCDTRPAPPVGVIPTLEPPAITCEGSYTVEAGDTLIEIAQACNTTVSALMSANPDIEDPSLIYTGQVIVMPDDNGERQVSIRPDSGPAGTIIRVYASGFPAGAQVQLGLGPPASEYEVFATREIDANGELIASLQIPTTVSPPDERVAVVVLDFEETISEEFTVTEGRLELTPTPTQQPDGTLFERTQIYLVALGDQGRSGESFGCGDSVVPVTVTFEPTPAPLTAALEAMFSIETRTYGQSGLYNVFYQSDLTVDGIDIVDREAKIALSGSLQIGGVCDEPRVRAQIERTATQYYTIDSVSITLNGRPLEESF